MKRILSMFIAVIMVISMLPAMVFTSAADAADSTGATENTGTTESTEATDSTDATETTEPVEPTLEISIVGDTPAEFFVGDQIQLSAKILPEGTEGTITWAMNTSAKKYFSVDENGLVTHIMLLKYTSAMYRQVKATATLADGKEITNTFTLPQPTKLSYVTITATNSSVGSTTKPIDLYPGDWVDVQVAWDGFEHYGKSLSDEDVSVRYETYVSNSTSTLNENSLRVEPIDGINVKNGARLTALTSLNVSSKLKASSVEASTYLFVKATVSFVHNGVTVEATSDTATANTLIHIKNDIVGDYANRAHLFVGDSYQLSAPNMAELGTITWESSKPDAISVDKDGKITVHDVCTNAIITASVTVGDTTYTSYQVFSSNRVIATISVDGGETSRVYDLKAAVNSIPANGTAEITMTENFEYNYDLTINSGKNVTLNLGDYTISRKVPSSTKYNMAALWARGGASLTINSGEKGSVVSTNGTKGLYAVSVGTDKGETGTVTINGGNFYGNTSAVYVMMGTATIYGGTFETDNPKPGYLLNCYDPKRKTGEAKIIVSGGEFKNFDPQNNAAEGTGTNFVDPALTSMDKGDGTFAIMEPATVNFDEFGFTVGETMSMDVTLTDPAFANTGKDCTVYLDVLKDGEWQQVGQEIKAPADASAEGKYSFNFSGIPMVYLSNNMRARMISHDDQGEEHGKTVTQFGEEGAKEDISFAHYAKALKASQPEDTKLCDLLNSMLNYITEAQKFKGYNTAAPANSDLTEAEKQVTSITEYTEADWSTYTAMKRGMTSPAAYDVKFTGSQLLMFSDKTGFRFHFTADSTDGLEMIIKIGDTEVSVTEFASVGDGEYTAEYAGFAPTAIDTQLKVVINKDGARASNIVYDSIPATAKYVATQDKHADQRTLLSSMLDYGKKATAYENKA